ncbi:MAG: amidohydrolase family protein [Verrucomicrobiota bacterium]
MSAGVISNVQIATPDEAVRPVDLFLDDSGRIGAIVDAGSAPFDDALCLFDGQGEAIIFPGFIDIHTHGANGADLSMATAEAVSSMAEAKLSEGVTSFLPTTWTASPEHTISMLEAAAGYARDQKFARTPCVHIEGPFINPAQAGAQDPEQIRLPDAAELERWMEIVPIGILSLAPERQGACEMIASCRERGIITSAAHSAASHADFLLAKENGLQHMTHFCNQMSGLHHREIGLVGSGLCDPDIRLELICDGIHLGEDMLKLIFSAEASGSADADHRFSGSLAFTRGHLSDWPCENHSERGGCSTA